MLRELLFLWHSLITIRRQLNGRWFYFRDRPDWYVEEIASYPLPDAQAHKDSEDIAKFIMEARFEQTRRIARHRR